MIHPLNQIEEFGFGTQMRFEREVLTRHQDLADFAIRIIQVTEYTDFGGTCRLTRRSRFTPGQTSIGAERTFIYRHRSIIHVSGIVRTGIHAVATENAFVRIDANDAVFIIMCSMGWTHLLARRVVAVLTLTGHESVGGDTEQRKLAFDLFDTYPDTVFVGSKQDTVFLFTRDFARFAVDAVFVIQGHSISCHFLHLSDFYVR